MTLKNYLLIMFLTTAICWSAFAVVVNIVNPEATNHVGFSLFYVSLFLSLVGTSAIIGFLFRFIALRKELVFRQVIIAFRQSFLFSGAIIAALLLQSQGMLTWYNAFFLIAALTVLEFFLISYKRV